MANRGWIENNIQVYINHARGTICNVSFCHKEYFSNIYTLIRNCGFLEKWIGRAGARTLDHSVNNLTLYRLSYQVPPFKFCIYIFKNLIFISCTNLLTKYWLAKIINVWKTHPDLNQRPPDLKSIDPPTGQNIFWLFLS